MRIILSRKGFDSAIGKCPSPIFPNGRMYSLPIPYEPGARVRFGDSLLDAELPNSSIGQVVEALSRGRHSRDNLVHWDPDLIESAFPRRSGWRASFGQVETQQSHLENENVGVGDVFLFHGWFRRVIPSPNKSWAYEARTKHLSVIFGWMQIGEILNVDSIGIERILHSRPWLENHPHLHFPSGLIHGKNALYIAAERFAAGGELGSKFPGAGVFSKFHPRLSLTAPDASGRSTWRLPQWFSAGPGRKPLTQYPNPQWWSDQRGYSVLRPRGRQGQEAVLDCAQRPEVQKWLCELLECAEG